MRHMRTGRGHRRMDVSEVTDTNHLFDSMATRDPDLGRWDTSQCDLDGLDVRGRHQVQRTARALGTHRPSPTCRGCSTWQARFNQKLYWARARADTRSIFWRSGCPQTILAETRKGTCSLSAASVRRRSMKDAAKSRGRCRRGPRAAPRPPDSRTAGPPDRRTAARRTDVGHKCKAAMQGAPRRLEVQQALARWCAQPL